MWYYLYVNDPTIAFNESNKHSGYYAFNYKMDIESFFEWFQGVLTKAGISKLTGMNQSLVSQYANGLKKPSKKQTTRIQTALHEFGEELLQIHF